jgi:hypothetical protein
MSEWLDTWIWILVAAAAVLLVLKIRNKPWLKKWRSHI